MQSIYVTLAERGQIVVPEEARDALGWKPGARLQLRVEDGRLLIEKRVQLDLSRWIGKAVDDGLSTGEALAELRGRPVPWQAGCNRPTRCWLPMRVSSGLISAG